MSCEGCNKPLGEESLQIGDNGDRKWHPECFKCTKCASPISGSFLLIDDKPHCPMCGTTCAKCSLPIAPPNAESVEVDGHEIHSSCFTCGRCQRELKGVPFTGDYPDLTCESCSAAILLEKAPTCARCNTKITEAGGLQLTNGTFHAACTVCIECGVDVSGGYAPADNGRLYCGEHASMARSETSATKPAATPAEPAPAANPTDLATVQREEEERQQRAKEAQRKEEEEREKAEVAERKRQEEEEKAKKKKAEEEAKKKEEEEAPAPAPGNGASATGGAAAGVASQPNPARQSESSKAAISELDDLIASFGV